MADRRKHSKVDDFPPEVVAAINSAIVNKRKTYKEIEEWLKADGYEIHQSSLQRYGKAFLTKLERITAAREQAKAILETSAGLKTEMGEATSTVAFQLLMDMMINTNAENADKTTLAAIRAIATLERSSVSREKLKMEYDKGVSAATEKMQKRMQEILKDEPELNSEIARVIEQIRDEMKVS